MAKFLAAVTGNHNVKFFRVERSDSDDPRDWELEPLRTEVLSALDSTLYHIVSAQQVLADGSVHKCYLDMNFPERVHDSAFFIENGSLRSG